MAKHQNFKNKRFSSLIIAEALLIFCILYVSFYVIQLADASAPSVVTYLPFIATFAFLFL